MAALEPEHLARTHEGRVGPRFFVIAIACVGVHRSSSTSRNSVRRILRTWRSLA
jgi:hypothetical protein